MHENNFASEILFLGPTFMITENFGQRIDQQNLSKNELACGNYIVLDIMKSIHKEQHIYHCDLQAKQILMDENFKITIIDWDTSEYVPGFNLNKTFVCKYRYPQNPKNYRLFHDQRF